MGVKFRRKRYWFSGLIFLFFISVNFVVIGSQADDYFDLGVKAARQQKFDEALKAFLQAKSAGLNTSELHYNLGVAYYKLGNYEKAAASFRHLIHNTEYASVAFYNLGLVDLKLGKPQSAKNWFSKAESSASDPDIKKLSELALHRVDANLASARFLGWSGFVSASVGYDDNVSLIDEDLNQSRGLADYHQEITAAATRMLWGTLAKGIQFTANTDMLEQQTEHRYDYSQWHLALTYVGLFGHWKTSAGVGVDRVRFSNESFQRLTGLEFRGARPISRRTSLELGYGYTDIEDQSPNGIYSYLEGNLHDFRLKLTDKFRNINLKYLYEIQLNDRQDYTETNVINSTTTTTTTLSYSPLRNIFQVAADVPVDRKLAVVLGAQYRYSYYRDADTQLTVTKTISGTTVNSTTLQRVDHRYRVNLGLQYSYNSDWQVFSNYSYTKNVSNRSGSDYRRSLFSAGVTWFF